MRLKWTVKLRQCIACSCTLRSGRQHVAPPTAIETLPRQCYAKAHWGIYPRQFSLSIRSILTHPQQHLHQRRFAYSPQPSLNCSAIRLRRTSLAEQRPELHILAPELRLGCVSLLDSILRPTAKHWVVKGFASSRRSMLEVFIEPQAVCATTTTHADTFAACTQQHRALEYK